MKSTNELIEMKVKELSLKLSNLIQGMKRGAPRVDLPETWNLMSVKNRQEILFNAGFSPVEVTKYSEIDTYLRLPMRVAGIISDFMDEL